MERFTATNNLPRPLLAFANKRGSFTVLVELSTSSVLIFNIDTDCPCLLWRFKWKLLFWGNLFSNIKSYISIEPSFRVEPLCWFIFVNCTAELVLGVSGFSFIKCKPQLLWHEKKVWRSSFAKKIIFYRGRKWGFILLVLYLSLVFILHFLYM